MRAGHPGGELDRQLQRGHRRLAGVDEAGRGALAGPVTAGAVILDPDRPIPGLADSKVLSPARRRRLAEDVRARAHAWAVIHVAPGEIDRANIVEATRRAMMLAVRRLRPAPDLVISDALQLGEVGAPVIAETGADGRYCCVAAASILAKVERDSLMEELAVHFPGFGWERNRGYGAAEHLAALARLGPSPLHRTSFAPMRVLA